MQATSALGPGRLAKRETCMSVLQQWAQPLVYAPALLELLEVPTFS